MCQFKKMEDLQYYELYNSNIKRNVRNHGHVCNDSGNRPNVPCGLAWAVILLQNL